MFVSSEYKAGQRVEHVAGGRQGTAERVTEAVLALALCHNVTPVYEEGAAEGSLPEAEQVSILGAAEGSLPVAEQVSILGGRRGVYQRRSRSVY